MREHPPRTSAQPRHSQLTPLNNPKPTTNETKSSNTMAERTVYLVHDAVHLRRSVELAPHRRQRLATQLLDHLLQLLDVEAALSVTTPAVNGCPENIWGGAGCTLMPTEPS
jgi:hypothetical protein